MLMNWKRKAALYRQTMPWCSVTSTASIIFTNISKLTLVKYKQQSFEALIFNPLSASGACLIIIGPENNDGGRHCEPEPLYLQIQESKEWRIEAKFRWMKLQKCVKDWLINRLAGEDLIAVYHRRAVPSWVTTRDDDVHEQWPYLELFQTFSYLWLI